jgi:hypothetical protein
LVTGGEPGAEVAGYGGWAVSGDGAVVFAAVGSARSISRVPSGSRLTEAYQTWLSSAGLIVMKAPLAWPRPPIRPANWASVGSSM